MATIDLGKIKLVWRGTYAGGTAYTVDDVVQHTDGGVTSSFICTTNSTGNAPSTGGSVHSSWAYLAKGHTDTVSTTLTTQGDILYRDGSGLQRLAAGTSGHVLKTQGSGANPVWGEVSGTFKQMKYTITATRATYSYSHSNNNTTNQVDTKITPVAVTITPESASSKILISCCMSGETSDSPWDYCFGFTRTVGGTDTMLAIANGVANQTGNRGKVGITAMPTSFAANSSNNDSTPEGVQYSFVDAPNTTSAITYTATFNNDNSGNWQLNATQNNSAGSERFVSTIYVMEF